jgi:adenylate cyclase
MISHDDEEAHQRVGKALASVNRHIRRYDGNVVSFSGDGLMAVFPSSRAALKCGIGIQKEFRDENIKVEPQRRTIFRVGMHAGEVVFQGLRAGGDPLNVAARLEQICQPGEICISATVLEQAGQTQSISVESIGATNLKNIERPVQAYRITLTHSLQAGAHNSGMSVQWRAKEISHGQPSIAVLPLRFVGGGAGDAYFAEDIVEKIIALLTDSREVVVIPPSSKTAHTGRGLDMPEVGRHLGVRYVLSGSVRRTTTTARVAAQLSDAQGLVVWADTAEVLIGERFDRQDRIAQTIVASILPFLGHNTIGLKTAG